jgi:hypothetical protein
MSNITKTRLMFQMTKNFCATSRLQLFHGSVSVDVTATGTETLYVNPGLGVALQAERDFYHTVWGEPVDDVLAFWYGVKPVHLH